MREEILATQCERGEELVAYLYGEFAASEARSFAAHLEECAACRAEAAAFSSTRAAITAWRMEALGQAGSSGQENSVPARAVAETAGAPGFAPRRPSAWAALREFFALSPLWLRGAGALATLALCALATLAVVNAEVRWDNGGFAFQTGWQQSEAAPTEATPRGRVYTEAEVAAIIAARDNAQRQLDQAQGEIAGLRQRASEQSVAPHAGDNEGLTPHVINTEVAGVAPQRAGTRRRSGAQASNATTRPAAPAVARDDYAVPRLYDLLGESE